MSSDYQERQLELIDRLAKPKSYMEVARTVAERLQNNNNSNSNNNNKKKKILPHIPKYGRDNTTTNKTAEAISDRLYRNEKQTNKEQTMFPNIWESNLTSNTTKDNKTGKHDRSGTKEEVLPVIREKKTTVHRKISIDAQEITDRLYGSSVRNKPVRKISQTRKISGEIAKTRKISGEIAQTRKISGEISQTRKISGGGISSYP